MRTVSRLIFSVILLVLTGLLVAAAVYVPGFFDWYTDFSRDALSFLTGITAPFPFALWEIILLLMVLWLIYTFARAVSKGQLLLCWLAGVVETVCVFVFLFVGLWGLNHWGPDLSDRLGLQVAKYSVEQLEDATRYMAQQASHWSEQVERDAEGDLAIDFPEMAKTAGRCYEQLAEPFFSGSTAQVKRLLVGEAFSYMGITGISVPFTGEACVNPYTYEASIPFTMCHEIAHRMTVAAENEANFAAFLACTASDDPAFQYSGWYSGYIYCYNALYKADRDAAKAIRAQLSPAFAHDLSAANTHYDKYEGQVQEAAQKVNDTYLKTFNEASGVRSYGEAVDLLLAWYQTKVSP